MNESKKNLEDLQFSELESLNDLLEESNNQQTFIKKTTSAKKTVTMTIVAMVSLVVLLLINFSLDVYQSYISIASSSTFLASLYLSIYFLTIFSILFYILFSIRSYLNLKDAFSIQEKTLNINGYEEEKEVSLLILNHYKHHQNQEISDKALQLYEQVRSNSIHSPFFTIKEEIINDLDKEATKTAYASAKEIALFSAFLPGSALDSITVIFSSFKLMKKIFHIYGYRTNIFTSMLIIRKIVENASMAALVEYADDSINDLIGNTLISKLSTKIAQGIGNGVLMLRISNIVIQSARPFASDGSIGSYKQMVKVFVAYMTKKTDKK